MSYRDWCFDDIDDYISNGFANPRMVVTLMMPVDEMKDEWSKAIHECLKDIWKLGRRMYVYAGVEGYDVYEDGICNP